MTRERFSRVLSLFLLAISLIQVVYTTLLLVFVYPRLKVSLDQTGWLLQKNLFQKAITNYFVMLVDGVYGYFLFFRPQEDLATSHLIAGTIIFLLSLILLIHSPLTSEPLYQFFLNRS